MRQWHVPPKLLCRKHLLGEHVEHHMLVGCLRRGYSLRGYTENDLVAVHTIRARHDAVAREMLRRGYNHRSPMPCDIDRLMYRAGRTNPASSLRELQRRCVDCRKRIREN